MWVCRLPSIKGVRVLRKKVSTIDPALGNPVGAVKKGVVKAGAKPAVKKVVKKKGSKY